MGMPAAFEKWTVDLLDALPESSERFELIDGELYVTPSPGLPHQQVVLRLAARLMAYTDQVGTGRTIISPSDVWKEGRQENRVQPDIYVVRLREGKPPAYPFHLSALMLVIEVASPGHPFLDYDVKRPLYLGSGVGEYWIINIEERTLTRFVAASEAPEVLTDRVEWLAEGTLTPFVLELPSFFDIALR